MRPNFSFFARFCGLNLRNPNQALSVIGIILGITALGAITGYFHYERVNQAALEILASPAFPRTCNDRLILIDHAITSWSTNAAATPDATPTKSDLNPYLIYRGMTVCPSGSDYEFGALRLATKCTLHRHAQITLPPPAPPRNTWRDYLGLTRARTWSGGRTSCIANLKQIDGATQQWALENQKKATDLAPASQIAAFLKGGTIPPCPNGGKYILKTVGDLPRCTIAGHTL